MKRIVSVGVVLLLASFVAWVQSAPVRPNARPPSRSKLRPPHPRLSQTTAPSPRLAEPPVVDHSPSIARTACSLPGDVYCAGSHCVALTTMPDLDAISGWWTLATQQPTFVAQTVARDLGWSTTPCAEALHSLEVLALEDPRGQEYWCATPRGATESVLLCNEAMRLHHPSSGLSFNGNERVLRF